MNELRAAILASVKFTLAVPTTGFGTVGNPGMLILAEEKGEKSGFR
jgi:hypothetical protein